MSANLVVDIGSTCDFRVSTIQGSGANLIVGEIVDLLHADTACNIFVAGGVGSGAVQLRVQTSDGLTSGSFTDPTSGMVDFPGGLTSGTILTVNSGLPSSGAQSRGSPVDAAPFFCSGGVDFGYFVRPGRYARLIQVSSVFPNPVIAGFVSQKRTTGSGGGFTFNPGSGSVNV